MFMMIHRMGVKNIVAHPQQNINKTRPLVERFGLESVPSNLRTTSSVEYAMIQIAISVNAGNVLVPALAVLEGGLSFFYAVLSTVVGAAAAFLFVSFLALPGAKYGIPAQYAIRSIMGVKGARYIASPVRTVTSLYWFAVQTIGGTYLLKELIEKTFHIQVPVISLALLMATIMAILALVGFEAVKKVTKYFLPILFIGSITMLFIFLTTDSKSIALQTEATNQLSAMLFFSSLAFVQYISGVSSSSDMARYAQSSNQAFYGLLTGNILGFTLTAILGAYAATMAGSVNPYVISSHLTASQLSYVTIIKVILPYKLKIKIEGRNILTVLPSLCFL